MRGKRYVYAGAVATGGGRCLGPVRFRSRKPIPRQAPKLPSFVPDGSWPKMPLPSAGDCGTPLVISTSTGKPKPWSTGEVAGTCIDSQRPRVHRDARKSGQLARDARFGPRGAGDRIRPRRQRRERVGRPQCPAQRHSRLLRRLPGQRLDRRQRRRHRAEVLARRHAAAAADRDARRLRQPANGNACGNSGGNPLANQSKTLLNQPANMWIDPNPDPVTGQRGSIYIADGYGNHRVVVFSATRHLAAAVGRRGGDGEQSRDRLAGPVRVG